MGPSPLSPSLTSTSSHPFSASYQLVHHDPQSSLSLLLSPLTHQHYLLKQLSTNSHPLSLLHHTLASHKLLHPNPYLLPLLDHSHSTLNTYCSIQYKSHLIFQKPYKDIRTEIQERKGKKGVFDEGEMMSVIETGVLGLKYLKEIGQLPAVGWMNSTNVLLTREGIVVLSDPWLESSPAATHIYPSPETYQNHQYLSSYKGKSLQDDVFISHLFSLGMVVLQMCHLEFMDEVYGFGREVNYSVLSGKMEGVQGKEVREIVDGLLGSRRKRLMVVRQMEVYAEKWKKEDEDGSLLREKTNSYNNTADNNLANKSSSPSKHQHLKPYNYHFPTPTPSLVTHSPLPSPIPSSPVILSTALPRSKPKHNRSPNTLLHKQKLHPQKLQQNFPIPQHNAQQTPFVNLPTISKPKSFSEIRNSVHHTMSHQNLNLTISPHPTNNTSTHYNQLPTIIITSPPIQPSLVSFQHQNKHNSSSLLPTQISNQICTSFTNTSSIMMREEESQGTNMISPEVSLEEDVVKGSPIHVIHNYEKERETRDIRDFKEEEEVGGMRDQVVTSKSGAGGYQCDYLMRSEQQQQEEFVEQKIQEQINKQQQKQEQKANRCQLHQPPCENKPTQNPVQQTNQANQSLQRFEDISPVDSCSPLLSQQVEPQDLPSHQHPLPLPKNPLHRPYQANSIIFQVSDSQNRSEGYLQLQQYGVLFSPSPSSSHSPSHSATKPSPYTTQHYSSGSSYHGQLLHTTKHGFGRFTYQDGAYVEGTWRNNQLHGYGKLYYSSGKLAYDGQYEMGEFHGYGKAYNNELVEVKGGKVDWRDFGGWTEEWEWYEGEIRHEEKHGKGKLVWTNGEWYEGEFRGDRVEGRGRFVGKEGVVEGVWGDNKLIEVIGEGGEDE